MLEKTCIDDLLKNMFSLFVSYMNLHVFGVISVIEIHGMTSNINVWKKFHSQKKETCDEIKFNFFCSNVQNTLMKYDKNMIEIFSFVRIARAHNLRFDAIKLSLTSFAPPDRHWSDNYGIGKNYSEFWTS